MLCAPPVVVFAETNSASRESDTTKVVDRKLATPLSYEAKEISLEQMEDGSLVMHHPPERLVYRGAIVKRDAKGFRTIEADTVEIYVDLNDGQGVRLEKVVHPQKPTRLPPAGGTPFGAMLHFTNEGVPVSFEWSAVEQSQEADEPRLVGLLGSKNARIGDVLNNIVAQAPDELRWEAIWDMPWILPAKGQKTESDLDVTMDLGFSHETSWGAIKKAISTANLGGTNISVEMNFLSRLSSAPPAFTEAKAIEVSPAPRTLRELLSIIAHQSPVEIAYWYYNFFPRNEAVIPEKRHGVVVVFVFERGFKLEKGSLTPAENEWWTREIAEASHPPP
jgi:hypothetical protein